MGNTRLIVGYSSTAAGAALIIAGGALAWVEKGKADNAQTRESGAATAKDATAWDLAHSDLQSARTLNSLGWVGAGVGAAALAGGLILISTAPEIHARALSHGGTLEDGTGNRDFGTVRLVAIRSPMTEFKT